MKQTSSMLFWRPLPIIYKLTCVHVNNDITIHNCTRTGVYVVTACIDTHIVSSNIQLYSLKRQLHIHTCTCVFVKLQFVLLSCLCTG